MAESARNRLITMPEGLPELTLGFEVIRWATRYLKHPNGPRAGLRWEFVRSQVQFLLWWYAVDESGAWLYQHGARRLPKGSGKSPFAALVCLAEFVGPVRLKDFDPKVAGGCVGKRVDMPLVQVVATSENQTANTMRMVRAFAGKGSKVVDEYGIDWGKTKYYVQPEGTLEVITSSYTAAEGAEVSFVLEDETEHWVPGNSGPLLAETVGDNLTKTGQRALELANAPKDGAGSVAQATYEAWLLQEDGKLQDSAEKILYDARVAPPGTDMADVTSLANALDYVYDDCFWVPKQSIIGKIHNPRTSRSASERKYLNWITADEDAWCTPQELAPLAVEGVTKIVADKEEIAMFFDGSKSRDSTALVGCRISDGHVFLIGLWEPKNFGREDAEEVSAFQVDATVAQAFDKYTVLGFFADVREWESFAKVSWPEKYGSKLHISAVKGGKDPAPIAWDMRSHTYEFTKACELTIAEIRENSFTYDGSAGLTDHVQNARGSENQWGTSITKESKDSSKKIDAAVCFVGARMVRRLVIAAGPVKKRSGRVY